MRLIVLTLLALLGCASCSGKDPIKCSANGDCVQGGIPGQCLMSTESANRWCAFQDSSCASGNRWGVLAGDGLAHECVADATGSHTISVTTTGSGTGRVTSEPAGIDCGATCSAAFPAGTMVTLNAVPSDGQSAFLGWSGACHGTDACSFTLDSDREVSAQFALSGTTLWLEQVGSPGEEAGNALARDADDNVVVVGHFVGTVDVGGIPLASVGQEDAFVAKLSALDGHALWAKRFGGSGSDVAQSVAIDGTGNVIVLGHFVGTVDFGGGMVTSAGSSDIFLLKLDGATGGRLWSQKLGGTGAELANNVGTDHDGDALVTGTFRASLSVGGPTFTNAGRDDAFVAKFAGSDGTHQWSRAISGTGTDVGMDLAVDSAGNVVVIGTFGTTVNVGATTLTSAGSQDIFVVKYAADTGVDLFARSYGSTGDDRGTAVAIDEAGGMYAAGNFAGTVSFGGAAPLMAVGSGDLFLVKMSLAGAHMWSKAFAGTAVQGASDAAVDGAGNVLITGGFFGTLSFGGDMLSSAGMSTEADMFLARFAGGTGQHLNSTRFGGAGSDAAFGIAIGSAGQVFTTGRFESFAEFGSGALTSSGLSDAFVLATAPF